RKVSSESKQEQQGKDTVLTFRFRSSAPVERLDFAIDPAQPNCRRELEIRGGKGEWLGSDEISRIHMYRHGQKIDVEQTTVYLRLYRRPGPPPFVRATPRCVVGGNSWGCIDPGWHCATFDASFSGLSTDFHKFEAVFNAPHPAPARRPLPPGERAPIPLYSP